MENEEKKEIRIDELSKEQKELIIFLAEKRSLAAMEERFGGNYDRIAGGILELCDMDNEGIILNKKGITFLKKHRKKLKIKKNDKQDQEVSFVIAEDGKIYEEIIYDGEPKFMSLNSGKAEVYDEIDGFRPIDDKAVERGAVLLPTGIEEYGNMKTLLGEIENFIEKWSDISPFFRKLSSWYVLLSWIYDRLTTIPYMRVLGDTGTGKTRYLDTVGRILYKPIIIAGAVNPAPLYRMIGKWKGSVVIDEADFGKTDYFNEVIKILNCGFETGKPIIRCDKENPNDLEFFDTFCPKVVATRQKFKDKALESRCITEIMEETGRKDIPSNLFQKFFDEQAILRNKLLLFRFRYWEKINSEKIINVDMGEIEPRLKQAMRPLTVLFSEEEDVMNEFRAFLVGYQQELIEERASSFEGMIVNILYSMIEEEGKEMISSSDIGKRMEEEFGMEKVNSMVVGRRIKSLGLETKLKKIEGKVKRFIILDEEKLKKIFKRYVLEVTAVTAVTAVTDTLPERKGKGEKKMLSLTRDDKNLKNFSNPTVSVTAVTGVTSVTFSPKNLNNLLPLNDQIPINMVIERISIANGVSQNEAEKILEKLIHDGLIYEPRPGYLRRV